MSKGPLELKAITADRDGTYTVTLARDGNEHMFHFAIKEEEGIGVWQVPNGLAALLGHAGEGRQALFALLSAFIRARQLLHEAA